MIVPDNDLSTFINDPFEDLLPEGAPMDEPDCRQRGANTELPECEEDGEFSNQYFHMNPCLFRTIS